MNGNFTDDSADKSRRIEILNDEILPEVKAEFNKEISEKRLERLSKEKEPIPSHPRNVTGVRTRLGLLLEFNLGRLLNRRLPDDQNISYGVAQAHLDLILRDEYGNPTARFEVKAMEDIAEEKAPSYDDLLQNLNKEEDFIVIFVWGWKKAQRGENEIRFPKIYDIRAFDAYEISKARDLFWVRNPKGERKNMIDVFGPVIQRPDGGIKEEEGNMGKLTRIVKRGDIESPEELSEFLNMEELERYVDFIEYCKGKGIVRAGELYLEKEGFNDISIREGYCYSSKEMKFVMKGESEEKDILVFSGGRNIIRNGSLVSTKEQKVLGKVDEENMEEPEFLILENEKFGWAIGRITGNETEIQDRGENIFGDIIGRQPI